MAAKIEVNRTEDKIVPGPDNRRQRFVLVQLHEVYDRVRQYVRGDFKWSSQSPAARTLDTVKNRLDKPIGSFYAYVDEQGEEHRTGPYGDVAMGWIDNGFVSKAMLNQASRIPAALQRRPRWNEEDGDIDVGRLAAGWDDFYLGTSDVIAKPGIKIRFEYAFAAGVNNTTISEYGAWIMKLIAGMESMGFDMAIDAWILLDDLMRDEYGVRTNVLLRVKNPGEATDLLRFSALFSPIGYRIIGFCAKALAADQIGKKVQNYFGMTLAGRNWGLEYDKDQGIVTITAAQRGGYQYGSRFPAEELTQKAVEAGLIPPQD
jgi:hypothetical protein